MNLKRFVCLLLGLQAGSLTALQAANYYVDPAGNDANNGTSEAAPWKSLAKVNATTFQPGDNIYFKRGGTWSGTLSPQGAGNSTAQITLTAYGTGAKPLINGAGNGSVISISGQSYWTIDGFEVTNLAGNSGGNRCGIRVGGGGDGSTIRRIRILNNDVHDIQATPNVNDGARNWGGIFVWIDEPGKADDVLIQGNTVTEIQGQGISFWGEFENAGGGMNYANCSPNVVVRGNKVWRTSGDGILTLGTQNELVECNEVAYVGALSGPGNNIAAAWPTRHVNGVWQYNHVHHTVWLNANDSTAFDNDGFVEGTTYFQYNYTHDNQGGFFMEYRWVADTGKSVVRYNISVNDGRDNYARVIASNRPAELYNNVFHNPGMTLGVEWAWTAAHTFRNNIFVGAARTAAFADQAVFFSNSFNGGVTRPVTTNGNRDQDPLFVSPNTTGNLAGFILQSSSPVRSTGQAIAGNGGKDFWGASVPASPTQPHRGASQINAIGSYTATPAFAHVSGPYSVMVPFSGGSAATFAATIRDQYFRQIAAPSVTWSLSPTVAGCSINSSGQVTLSSAAAGQRFAVTATSGAATHTFSFSTTAPVWTNSAGTGIWNTTDANWSGLTWADGADATFAHTSAAQTVTLSGTRSAAAVKIGNGSNNASYTFTGGPGNSLTATSIAVQGAGSNDPGLGSTILNNLTLTTPGDLRVGRWDLIFSGDSVVNIGGQLRSTADGNGPGDWGRVTLQDNANVTATGGVNSSGSVWGLSLNGGTLITPVIRAAENSYSAGSRLTFNGTTVVATQDNASFITVDATGQAYVNSGGAKFDTDGHDIGIPIALQGGGGLTKSGLGTLTLSGNNSYTGTTSISGGTLAIQGPLSSASHTIAAGAVFELNRASGIDYASGTTFTGTGTLRKTGAGEVVWGAAATTFSLSAGALIDIREGVFVGGSHANETWTNNESDLNVEAGAVFKAVEANVRLNRITGGGTLGTGYSGAGYQNLTIGLVGGSSTFAGSITNTDNNPSFVGNVVKEGAGTIILTGTNTYSGSTTINGGTLQLGNGSPGNDGTLSNTSGIANNAALVFNLAGTQTIGTSISGNGTFTKTGPGTLNLQSFGGAPHATISGGTLHLTGGHNNYWAVQNTTVAAGARLSNNTHSHINELTLDGGELAATGADVTWGSWMLDQTVTVNGNGVSVISAPRVAIANASNVSRIFNVAASATLDVTGTFEDAYTTTGNGLTKTGAGTMILSAANSYTGPTSVNEGTLRVNGSTATASALTIAGTATLGGHGTIGGSITVNPNGTLAPGSSVGTLNAGSAGISGKLAIEISGSSADCLNVTGNLNITNATLAITGALTANEYVIASYGSLTGSAFASITGLPAGYGINYSNNQIRIVANPPFASWIEVNYPTLSDKTVTGDPDNDGLENILEYVLGGNPSLSDTGLAPTVSSSGANLVFTFRRVDASETADLSLVVEAGTNIASWPEIHTVSPGTPSPGVAIQENGGSPDTIIVTIPQGPGTSKFARLRVMVMP